MEPLDPCIENLLRPFARAFARLLADELRAGNDPAWVDQASSQLGPRRHCALARKLVAKGDGDASHIGRRWLIRRERLDSELAAPQKRKKKSEPASDLAAELGLVATSSRDSAA